MKTRQLCVSTVASTLVLFASLFTVTSYAAPAHPAFANVEPSQPAPAEPTQDDLETLQSGCDLIPVCVVIPTHVAGQQG